MLYELFNLERRFGPRTVLDIDYLGFEGRRVYAVIGPNGAGKTTLLNQLAFLDQPSAGEIVFRGNRVQHDRASLTRLRRQAVLVDQSPILFTGTVWRNVEFGLKVRNIGRRERQLRVEEALERVGMSSFARSDAHGLSGGEVKRVALARALALEPGILLCDEPTANVDQEHQEIIMKILAHANSVKQTTVIFTTHYLAQVKRLAQRVLYLQSGRLSQHRDDNVFPALVRRRGNRVILPLGGAELAEFSAGGTELAENRTVRVHVIPEQVRIEPGGATIGGGNGVHGQVRSVTAENGRVRIVVDIGVELQAVVPAVEFSRRPVQVMAPVTVRLPREAVVVLP